VLSRQPLDLTAGVIAGATVVIGVDTGLLHLAAAYRVPLVGIYVATDPGLTGPVGSGLLRVLGGKNGGPSAQQATEAAEQLLG
jgi:heptosyltransferase-1